MRVYHEDQFGPVVPVVPFEGELTVVEYLVDTPYGQQLKLFGTDPEQIARLIVPMVNQVCRVNITSQCQRGPDTLPFTGRKDSAEGTRSRSRTPCAASRSGPWSRPKARKPTKNC